MTTPPPLPDTVDYHHVITLLEDLLPGFNPASVTWVSIDPQRVRIAYLTDGYRETMHVARITHRQGPAVEGGGTTPPPLASNPSEQENQR